LLKCILHPLRDASPLTSLYPEHNVIEILIRIPIVTIVSETVLDLLHDHPRTISPATDSSPPVTRVPDIPDVDVTVLGSANYFN